ncbi:hypothetical protein UlMin_004133 [Ulmus minor]
MGGFDDYKPVVAMVGLQIDYAGTGLSTGATFLQGMNSNVIVVYRQAITTLFIAPIAYFSSVVINQNVYFEGMYFASSSMASAMGYLVPVIPFIIASIFGLEKINIKSLRSIAKILGTLVCVIGAVSMALLKGPKLLNTKLLPAGNSIFGSTGGENWLLGCLFLFASSCCWSIWLIRKYSILHSFHKKKKVLGCKVIFIFLL